MKRYRIELASVATTLALTLGLVLAGARTSAADDSGSTQKPAADHKATDGTSQPSSPAETKPAAGSEEKPAKTSETKPAAPPDKKKSAKTTKAKRRYGDRLPQFFKDVVTDDEQKEKIYALQDEYAAKLKPLRDQLQALTAERDAKIDDVLTADQKQAVQAKRAEAEAKRREAADAKRAEKAEAKRAAKKEARKSAKHIATPSTEKTADKPGTDKPAEKPAEDKHVEKPSTEKPADQPTSK
jgi:cell division protein ZapA (FtsZ GTPase activity inhibitor)